jgi:hypothetical protein
MYHPRKRKKKKACNAMQAFMSDASRRRKTKPIGLTELNR